MLGFIRRLFSQPNVIDVGPPAGKTGNEWTEEDFAHLQSNLALKGGPEFVEYCIECGKYELVDDVLERFREILKKYPADDEEEYDYLGVVVRQRLVDAGLLPQGDPERYQYKISTWAPGLAQHG